MTSVQAGPVWKVSWRPIGSDPEVGVKVEVCVAAPTLDLAVDLVQQHYRHEGRDVCTITRVEFIGSLLLHDPKEGGKA